MGQNTTVLGIVAVVVLIAVILSPMAFDFLWEGWSTFWSQWDQWTTEGQAKMSVGATIYYEDGTKDEVDGTTGIPLTVTYKGKALKSIEFQLYGIITYSGTITKIMVDSTIEFDFNGDTIPEKHNSKTGTVKTPTESGNIYAPELVSLTILSSELEGYAGDSGEYTTTVRGRGKVTVTFSDGSISDLETKEDATGSFTFNISLMGAYTEVLKAYVGTTPLY